MSASTIETISELITTGTATVNGIDLIENRSDYFAAAAAAISLSGDIAN